MLSLTDNELIICATRTGAFGVRVIQPNEISDFSTGAAGAGNENHACMTVTDGAERRGLEQGKQ